MDTPNLTTIQLSGSHAIGFHSDGKDLMIAHLIKSRGQVKISSVQRLSLSAALESEEASSLQAPATEASPFGADLEASVAGLVDTIEKSEDDDRLIVSAMQRMPVGKSKLGIVVSPTNVRFFNGGEILPGEKNSAFIDRVRADVSSKIGEEVTLANSFVEVQPTGPAFCIVHRDRLKLMDWFEANRKNFGNPRMRYELIDPVEVSLAGVMNREWPATADEVTVLIHIGKEYTHLMVFRDGEVLAVAPLIPTGSSPQSLMQTLSSKILFEQDELGIPDVHRFALSGMVEMNEAREFFERRYPHSTIRILKNGGCDDSFLTEEELTLLSEFTVAIGIALKILEPKTFWESNLLPEAVRRSQKVLSFAWHSFVLIGLLFLSTMAITFKAVGERANLQSEKRILFTKQAQDRVNQANRLELDSLNANLAELQRLLSVSDSLSIGSHRWSNVLSELNVKGRKISGFWIESIHTSKNGIVLMGKSRTLAQVNEIARIFPNTVISSVSRVIIRNSTIYKYELKIPYPPDEPPHDFTPMGGGGEGNTVPGDNDSTSIHPRMNGGGNPSTLNSGEGQVL